MREKSWGLTGDYEMRQAERRATMGRTIRCNQHRIAPSTTAHLGGAKVPSPFTRVYQPNFDLHSPEVR